MPRAGPRKVQRYSLEFKLKAMKLSQLNGVRVQASLDQRQRFQLSFFPEGIAFDGNRFVRTGVTAPAFSYLRGIQTDNEGLVDQAGIEPATS